MNFRNTLYAFACLTFSVILGAAIYEHTAVWPPAFSEIPRSLSIFQGPYKLNAAAFWVAIHPITLALLTLTLTVHWKTARRKNILFTLTGYIAILATTFAFFVPELIDLTSSTYTDTVDPDLQRRGTRWITLSLVRAGVLVVLAVTLILGLTKKENK